MTQLALRVSVNKQNVSLVLMPNKQANAIVEEHHYLHRKRVGRLVSYAVLVDGDFNGVLMFARAMVNGPMFGYKPTEIVELARVWFRVNHYNLGSCALGIAFKKLSTDWPGTKAVVSWCDTTRFDGALYKASNFKLVGLSRTRSAEPSSTTWGGGRPGRKVQSDRLNRKTIWLKEML